MFDFTRARCAACNVLREQRRLMVHDPSGAQLPAIACLECEAVCLVPETFYLTVHAAQAERVESERNRALEAKCALLAASLR